jgi:predicted DNA-binding protein (MmcQ/YjbR family)
MTLENLRRYCLSKPGTTEEFPFDRSTMVFKVMGKMYVLTDVDVFDSINVKCDPEKAVELRERYEEVTPGYHMNKTHWNTVRTDGTLPDRLLLEWVDESYRLVVAGLPHSKRIRLKAP